MNFLIEYHIFQTFVAFFGTLVYARILGKTQISQLSFYDYVNGITIGSIAAFIAVEDTDETMTGFISLTVFCLLTYVIAYGTLKSRPLRKLIQGEPTIVIAKGKIIESSMAGMRYDLDELMAQLREKDIFHLAEVEYAILESDGQLSVLKKQPAPTIQYKGLATELILDGQLVEENLQYINHDEAWLKLELSKRGINDVSQVMYASVDENGNLYVDKRSQ